jgi:hypothetical protein
MGHGHETHIEQENYQFKGKAKTISLALLVIGLVFSIIGIINIPKDNHHHETESTLVEASHDDKTKHEVANHHKSDFNIHGVDVAHSNEQIYPIEQEHAKPWYTEYT